MTLQCGAGVSCSWVPEADSGILASRSEDHTVWRKRDGRDATRMSPESAAELSDRHIPK